MLGKEFRSPALFKHGLADSLRLFLLAVVAFILLYVDSHYQALSVVRQVVSTAFVPIQAAALLPRDAARYISGYFADLDQLRKVNQALEKKVQEQGLVVQRVQFLEAENQHLNQLLGMRSQYNYTFLATQIRSETNSAFEHTVVIDRGSRDGVSQGMPVVSEAGLLGQVSRVLPTESEVILAGDKRLSVPVQVLPGGVRAVATGNLNRADMSLRFFTARVQLEPNSVAVTSGVDGVYPPGIKVCHLADPAANTNEQTEGLRCHPKAIVVGRSFFIVMTKAVKP